MTWHSGGEGESLPPLSLLLSFPSSHSKHTPYHVSSTINQSKIRPIGQFGTQGISREFTFTFFTLRFGPVISSLSFPRAQQPILGCMSYGDKRWANWVIEGDEALEHMKEAFDMGINTFE